MLCYLAMTAAEMRLCRELPPHIAWMACHYAPYGTGLSNLPTSLPEGSLLVINDRTPAHGHDPEYILWQLDNLKKRLSLRGILLDLQRQGCKENAAVAAALTVKSDIPVAVTEAYARELDCPVFLSPPLHLPLEQAFLPWQGRPIWLECALCRQEIQVTPQGSSMTFPNDSPEQADGFTAEDLHCRYHIQTREDQILFHLYRSRDLIPGFLEEAGKLGAELAIGLYQQLKS